MPYGNHVPDALVKVQASIFGVELFSSLVGCQVAEERAKIAVGTIRQGLPSVLAILPCTCCIYIYHAGKFLDRQQIPTWLFVSEVVLDAFSSDRFFLDDFGVSKIKRTNTLFFLCSAK